MIRSDELEFELEDETEDEFEYEDEADLFDPAPPPRGVLLTRFAPGSATLTAEHRRMIPLIAAAVIRVWPRDPNFCLNVTVEGHEDELGDPARFGVLGQLRAQAVADALRIQVNRLRARIPAASRPKGRVPPFAVETAGPRRPIRSNVTAQGRALNRRVEVRARRPDVCPDVV